MKQFTATVTINKQLSTDFFELSFTFPKSAGIPVPGQFLTIRASQCSVPLLRRPFAFASYDELSGIASVIYQKRGIATELLTGKQQGDTVDIIGPLGNPFPLPQSGKPAILIAGGVGLGPILFLRSVLHGDTHQFLFGARNEKLVPKSDVFTGANPIICTDDGSLGFKGTVLDYLNSVEVIPGTTLYACGPMPMLKACNQFAIDRSLECWISVEQVMACGVGACMGCVVRVNGPQKYARACKEGPVFNSLQIDWDNT